MKGATSLAELQAQIEEAVGDSLGGDISDFIKRRLIAHAQSDVYAVYPSPVMYGRRDSLLDEDQYVDYTVKTTGISRLVITPMQSFNPHIMIKEGRNWFPATSQNSGNELAGLINYGDTAYKGYGYDFYQGTEEGDASYTEPRPFLDNTVDELENGELGDQLWVSLKKRGYNVK